MTLQSESKAPNSPAAGLRGLVEILNSQGMSQKSWKIRQAKCLVGAAIESDLRIVHPDLAPQHLVISFGRRHVAVKSLAGMITINGRLVREWLFDERTEIGIGNLRLLVTPASLLPEALVEISPSNPPATTTKPRPANVSAATSPSPSTASPTPDLPSLSLEALMPRIEAILKTWMEPMRGAMEDFRSNLEVIQQRTASPVPDPSLFRREDLQQLEGNLAERIDNRLQMLFDEVERLRRDASEVSLPVVDASSVMATQQLIQDLDRTRAEIAHLQQQLDFITEERNAARATIDQLSHQLSATYESVELQQQNSQFGQDEQQRMLDQLASLDLQMKQVQQAAEEQIQAWQVAHEELQQQVLHWQAEAQRLEQELQEQRKSYSAPMPPAYEPPASDYQHTAHSMAQPSHPTSLPPNDDVSFRDEAYGYQQPNAYPSYDEDEEGPSPAEVYSSMAYSPTPETSEDGDQGFAFAGYTDDDASDEPLDEPMASGLAYAAQEVEQPTSEDSPEDASDEMSPFLAAFLRDKGVSDPYAREEQPYASEEEVAPPRAAVNEVVEEEEPEEVTDSFRESEKPVATSSYGLAAAKRKSESEIYASLRGQKNADIEEDLEEDDEDDLESEAFEDDATSGVASSMLGRSLDSSVVGNDSAVASGEEDEDSIEAYMQRLLQRVRGKGDEDSLPSTPVAPVTPRTPVEVKRARMTDSLPSLKESLATPTSSSKPLLETPANEITPPAEREAYVPRQTAPEKDRNMAAMRELANSTARTAIDKSDRRKLAAEAFFKSAVVIIGLVGGLGLLATNGFRPNMALVGALAGFGVAFLWGFEALNLSKSLRSLDAAQPSKTNNADRKA